MAAGYTSPAPWWIRQHQPLRAGFCSPAPWIGWKVNTTIIPPAPEEPPGGSKNVPQSPVTWEDIFKDVITPISKTMYVKRAKEPYFAIKDVELEIDGKPFDLAEWEPPSAFIREAPGVAEAIDRAAEKMGVSQRKARQKLFDLILDERKKVESVKQSLFNDDEEIIAILLATDDI